MMDTEEEAALDAVLVQYAKAIHQAQGDGEARVYRTVWDDGVRVWDARLDCARLLVRAWIAEVTDPEPAP